MDENIKASLQDAPKLLFIVALRRYDSLAMKHYSTEVIFPFTLNFPNALKLYSQLVVTLRVGC